MESNKKIIIKLVIGFIGVFIWFNFEGFLKALGIVIMGIALYIGKKGNNE